MGRSYKLVCLFLLMLVGTAWAVTTCTISGVIQNADTTPCANCAVQFNSMVTQIVNSVSIAPQIVSTKTDSNGNLTPITINQGLSVQITITENGQTFAPFGAIIPNQPAATFSNLAQGVTTLPLNILASLQPPTGPLNMNAQRITNLAQPTTNGDALAWGDNAVVNNLTVTGGFSPIVASSGSGNFGLFTNSQVSTPSAPFPTAIGVTGATTYFYFIVCLDGNGGTTLPSLGGGLTNANAALGLSNYNSVAFNAPAHSSSCVILRNATNTTVGAQQCTGSPMAISVSSSPTAQTFLDQSNTTTAYVLPTRNTTGDGTFAGAVSGAYFIGNLVPSIGGGGALTAGSNSTTGIITSIAATGNVLTPGFTCPHSVVGAITDEVSAAILYTARNATTVTFNGTAGHNVDYAGMGCI
jgi:hypothetical protein